jgi:hypothetical protein
VQVGWSLESVRFEIRVGLFVRFAGILAGKKARQDPSKSHKLSYVNNNFLRDLVASIAAKIFIPKRTAKTTIALFPCGLP